MRDAIHALVMGYYGERNLGDEMMLFLIREWLRRQNIAIGILAENAVGTVAGSGVGALQNLPLLGEWAFRDVWLRGKAWKLIRAIGRYDALVSGGGDNIRDDRGWRQFLYAVEKILLSACLGKNVYLVNVGIGEPSSLLSRWLLRIALRACRQIIVRDADSYDLCRRLGAGEKTTLAPDIVTALPSWLDLPAESAGDGREHLLVCLREHPNVYGGYDLDPNRLRVLAAGLDALVDRFGIPAVFLPFQDCEEECDNRLAERVRGLMRRSDAVVVQPWTGDLGEVCGSFRRARLVLAMRLHAAVLAAALGRRCLVMPYDRKVRAFAAQCPLAIMEPTGLDRLDDLEALVYDVLEQPAPDPERLFPPVWDNLELR